MIMIFLQLAQLLSSTFLVPPEHGVVIDQIACRWLKHLRRSVSICPRLRRMGRPDGHSGKAHIKLPLQNCAYWTRQPLRVKKSLLEDEDSASRFETVRTRFPLEEPIARILRGTRFPNAWS